MTTPDRWRQLWRGLGVDRCDEALRDALLVRYAEPHRHYHTAQHLTECFEQWEHLRAEAARPWEVELALWFHDAVYDPRRDDNEKASAAIARDAVEQVGLGPDVASRVIDLILATRHEHPSPPGDAERLVDVDLAILGATAERFDEYERQVRAEYSWVPDLLFRHKRREVLSRFLERPHIYCTAYFRQVAEARARENLRRSIAQLGRGGGA